MSVLRVRPLDPERDLIALLDLVGYSRARGDASAIFHPGGLQCWLRRIGRSGFEVAVVSDNKELVGLLLRDEGDVIVQTDAAHTKDRADLLAWAETRVRETGEPEMLVSVAQDDDDLRQLVISRGYEPTERYGYELVYDLAAEPDAPEVPPGFEMISLTPELADAYVALHRAAWSRPNAPSTYDRRQHDAVTAMPDFRYDLVPIVTASDGALAASQSCARSRAARGSSARSTVLVWGVSANPVAKALYVSAGMHARRVLRDYRIDPTGARARR